MKINLSGHHVEVTAPLRAYVVNKVKRIERHFDNVIGMNVILAVEKLQHKAEATLNVNGKTIFADAIADDMYAAVDALTDKLDRQVRKHKEKITDHHRSAAGEH